MKAAFYFLITTVVLISCDTSSSEHQDIEDLSETQVDSLISTIDFRTGDPIFIEGTDMVLFPLADNRNWGKKKKSEYGSRSYEADVQRNVLFYNRSTHASHVLTEDKCIIDRIQSNIDNKSPLLDGGILYEFKTEDYNEDKKFDALDPTYLYYSDNTGKGLSRLSPDKEYLINYRIVPGADHIFMKTRIDSNSDKKFDGSDDYRWYFLDLKNSDTLLPVIDTVTQKKVAELYFEQWVKK